MRWRSDLFGGPREWSQRLTVATAVGALLGVLGPFGTYANPGGVALRIAYWTGMFWTGSLIFSLTVRPASALGPRLGFSRTFSALAAAVPSCIPLAVVVALIGRQLWPGSRDVSPLIWYGDTLLVSLPIVFVYALWHRRADASRTAAQPSSLSQPVEASSSGTFLRRLPANLGRELLCLQMEDHYVRAHTPLGSALVLIPLKDAIAELGDMPGLRVHRSWWVARAALDRPVSDGRNLKLRLVNGLEVPVARTGVAEVRAAGWLA